MYDDEAVAIDRHEQAGVPYSAIILSDPGDITDDVFVTIPQLDSDEDPRGTHKHGPCLGWDAHSDGSLPSRNDKALVFVDDDGDYWIAAWSSE